jgi:hypothetical protein
MEFGESQPILQYPVYDMNKDKQGYACKSRGTSYDFINKYAFDYSLFIAFVAPP